MIAVFGNHGVGVTGMGKQLSGIVGVAAIGLIAAGVSAQTPRMSEAEARQLYAAGGFPISADGKNPTNRCGKAASPRITFVDMNADGRKEALFIDAGPCYGADGRWYAVATPSGNGGWRRILEGPGAVAAAGTQANGWFVLNTTSGGKTTRLHYNGTSYAEASAAAAPPATARPAAGAQAAKAAVPAPAAAGGRDAAIFRAAGLKQTRRGWESGCDDPSAGAPYDAGAIEQVKDVNGDGRPEAIFTEGGSYCYGNTGTAFWLVSQQADGSWKLLYNEIGIAEFLAAKGAGGWPDVSVGGPGFCFPVVRWNGKAYVLNRWEYEGKACKRPAP